MDRQKTHPNAAVPGARRVWSLVSSSAWRRWATARLRWAFVAGCGKAASAIRSAPWCSNRVAECPRSRARTSAQARTR